MHARRYRTGGFAGVGLPVYPWRSDHARQNRVRHAPYGRSRTWLVRLLLPAGPGLRLLQSGLLRLLWRSRLLRPRLLRSVLLRALGRVLLRRRLGSRSALALIVVELARGARASCWRKP